LGGAPGLPPCRAPDGSELTVSEITIDSSGNILARRREGANSLEPFARPKDSFGKILSRTEFQREFAHWREHGRRQNPACLFSTVLVYDPKAPAGEYQPSRAFVASVFWIRSTTPEKAEQ
jgi:hypothetical protein